ncbi:hypothetical protein ACOMHN_062234 [Nucella lapillus]
MTFCPEWLTGSKSLVTDNFLYLWLYLVFFNMLWVVIPLALMYHSWGDIRDSGIAPDFSSPGSRVSKKAESYGSQESYASSEGTYARAALSSSRYNLRARRDQ